ncbi:DUF4097 family beta strand repeat-containing protein [Acutalibacter caecimuris]|uniref:DUF4097 family beta strand repeat-containing protein n=1 Tax=Acutalibacter caecimuris TaxID=3093657 RepID=UPI002AC8F61E|nr:DUF4097 family beta strand repeat-containing protein [Acutalibacter sp. M00118]
MKKLKKSQIFLIITCGAAALFFTLVLMAGLSADNFGFGESGKERVRNNVNTRDIDPVEAEVNAVEISWLTGPVSVGVSPDSKIHVTERSAKKLDEGQRMDVSVKSGKLTVRWDNQWFRRWFNVNLGGWFGLLDKELEVLLPPDLAKNLVVLQVENTSDDLTVDGCSAEEVTASTVSGYLILTDCTAVDYMGVNSVSGDVILEDIAGGEELNINTVSGGVAVTGGATQELQVHTVSGDCQYKGTAEELCFDTVSGNMAATLGNCPENADMNSVSGGLLLYLPAGSGFTVDHSSVSGEFRSDFSMETVGGKSRCGSGEAEIKMNTTSGEMAVDRAR